MKEAIKVALTICLLAVATLSLAQEEGKSKKELKKEKKEAKKAARAAERVAVVLAANELLINKTWVLEASRLRDRRGSNFFNLDANLNFVTCEIEKGTIQLAFDGLIGWNGVGGVTLEGRYTTYTVKEPKKEGQGATLQATISGTRGVATLFLTVRADEVEAKLSGNWGTQLTFFGKLVHPSQSNAYKGIVTY